MYSLANGRNILGQMQPFLTPALTPLAISETPVAAPAAAPAAGNGVGKAGIVGLTLLYAGLGVANALFLHGVAKESQSKTVRTTGYILAGVAGLSVLATVLVGGGAAVMAGPKR